MTARDKNGNVIHIGSKVRSSNGETHVVNGMGSLHGAVGLPAIRNAKFVDFARDIEVVDEPGSSVGRPDTGAVLAAASDQSIVWGNGQ